MSSGSARALLNELERGASQSDPDIPSLLRKCVALGGQSGSTRLREWATRELKGYRGDAGDALPEYRKVPAAIVIDGATMNGLVTGQQISPVVLPPEAQGKVEEEVQFWGPIVELSDMVKRATADHETVVGIGIAGGSALAGLMNYYAQQRGSSHQITRVYRQVAVTSIVGILDAVQTNLVELVAEIRAGLPGPDAEPDRNLADRAVNVVIYGDRNRIELKSTAVSSGDGVAVAAEVAAQPESRARRIMWWVVGIAGVVAAVVGVFTWHPWAQ